MTKDNSSNNSNTNYELPCNSFAPVAKFGNDGRLDYSNKTDQEMSKTKCLRIKVFKGQSNWIMVRLIQIEIKEE